MEQISSIHRALKKRDKSVNWPYLSSIMVKNDHVPPFETKYGQLDYEWILAVTKHRKCVETQPYVIRHVHGDNLSHNDTFRKHDFYQSMMLMDDDLNVVRSMYGTRGRYYYFMGDMVRARFHFIRGKWNIKTFLYICTSYCKPLAKFISRKFDIFG